jgi:hypothetical protein
MSNITDRREVADKLREAKALIERRGGWTKGVERERVDRDDGSTFIRVCSVGAIRATSAPVEAYQLLAAAIGNPVAKCVMPFGIISHWNDNPKRRKRQVLAAFDKAITLADSSQ